MRRLILLVPLLAAACATRSETLQPKTSAAASAPFTTRAPGVDAIAQTPDDWWRLYRDPTLDRLVTRALAANADLRVAAANLARAQAVTSQARSDRLPSTDLSAGYAYGDRASGSRSDASHRQWTTTGSLAVAWELDLFGRVGRAVEAADADAQAVEAVRDRVRAAVVAATTRSYVEACALAESAGLARQSLSIAEAGLRLVDTQQSVGAAARLDVERAAAAAASARAAIPPIEAQRQAALFELAALIGATPSALPVEATACVHVPAPTAKLPIGDGAALLRRRPDIREAERRLAADSARIGVATAELYPRISIGGSTDLLRNDEVRGNDALTFSAGPLVSWSFPNIVAARARLRQAKAQGDASLAAFDGAVLTALKEVEQALATYAGEQERATALLEAQTRADTAYRLADMRYRAGSLSYLDLLVAQGDLIDARTDVAASARQVGVARVDLFKALGGGWGGR